MTVGGLIITGQSIQCLVVDLQLLPALLLGTVSYYIKVQLETSTIEHEGGITPVIWKLLIRN